MPRLTYVSLLFLLVYFFSSTGMHGFAKCFECYALCPVDIWTVAADDFASRLADLDYDFDAQEILLDRIFSKVFYRRLNYHKNMLKVQSDNPLKTESLRSTQQSPL